jgi:molecular chaperone GrpE (heat shock protein)
MKPTPTTKDQLEAVKLSAQIAQLEQDHKEIFERWHQLKAELKAIENRMQPPMNFEAY